MLQSLGFSTVTFVVTIINIIILFFIFRAILFKPVTKLMADRAKKIQNSIDQAEKDKANAQQLLDRYQEKLKTAEAEAEEILKDARENASAEAARIVAGGKASAEALLANTRRQLEAERRAALARFKAEAAALIIAASSKLAARELNSDDNRRYANMLLNELAVREGNN